MLKTTYSKLVSKLELTVDETVSELKDKEDQNVVLEVKHYLPMAQKAELIQFVANGAIDEATGTFSPLRVEAYFAIAICKWYANISFTEKQLNEINKVYDVLESGKIIAMILDEIPEDERTFMRELVEDTISDIARYNSSAAGIIQNMSSNAGDLESQISAILKDIQDGKGLEQLAVIKDVVGSD